MAKKQSEAARVLRFFDQAPQEVAQTIYDLVRDRMKARGLGQKKAPAKKPKVQPLEEKAS